jgi:uncharacterized protein YndB with AHSA1/START domain
MAERPEGFEPRDPGMPLRDDELLIVRHFEASLPLVFRMWEDAVHRANWWAPRGCRCTHFRHEFREGGPWRACFVSEQGREHWQGGTYQRIDRERRIAFTFAWDAGPAGGVETLVTVTFVGAEGGVIQTFHQTPFATRTERDSHVAGWSGLFDREQAAARASADRVQALHRRRAHTKTP